MPSLIFPPTTESSRAPVSVSRAWPWPQCCGNTSPELQRQSVGAPSRGSGDPQPHLDAPGILQQHLLHLICSLGLLKYLKVNREHLPEKGVESLLALKFFRMGTGKAHRAGVLKRPPPAGIRTGSRDETVGEAPTHEKPREELWVPPSSGGHPAECRSLTFFLMVRRASRPLFSQWAQTWCWYS